MGDYFTQYKQWIEFQVDGQRIGRYMERVSGGQVEYAVADGAPANSGGHVYRATRFRIAPLNIGGYLTKEQFNTLVSIFKRYHSDRSLADKFSVRRIYKDGSGQAIEELYERLTVVSPPEPEDGDTTQDGTFMNFSIGLQPEKKTVFIDGQKSLIFDPDDELNGSNYINP